MIEAIIIINDAENKSYDQQFRLEQNLKLAKYDLQERYFHLIEEILCPETCEKIQSHYYETFPSIDELNQRIEDTVSE